MKKEEFQELKELSLKVFGMPYAWKKLRTKGLVTDRQVVGKGFIARRMPLTVAQAKHYMITTLEMQAKMIKDMGDKKNENRG